MKILKIIEKNTKSKNLKKMLVLTLSKFKNGHLSIPSISQISSFFTHFPSRIFQKQAKKEQNGSKWKLFEQSRRNGRQIEHSNTNSSVFMEGLWNNRTKGEIFQVFAVYLQCLEMPDRSIYASIAHISQNTLKSIFKGGRSHSISDRLSILRISADSGFRQPSTQAVMPFKQGSRSQWESGLEDRCGKETIVRVARCRVMRCRATGS